MDGQSKSQASISDAEITLGVLNAIEADSGVTQRSVAQDLGIALGLTNAYLKRCIKKGYVKISQAPRNRYAYYLTPTGFAEKSRLTAEFLSQSFNFFRVTRRECTALMRRAAEQGRVQIVLVGATDLTEVALLCARDVEGIEVTAVVVAEDAGRADFLGLPVVVGLEACRGAAAVLVTDMRTPQATFDAVSRLVEADRILTPSFLHVSRKDPAAPVAEGDR